MTPNAEFRTRKCHYCAKDIYCILDDDGSFVVQEVKGPMFVTNALGELVKINPHHTPFWINHVPFCKQRGENAERRRRER